MRTKNKKYVKRLISLRKNLGLTQAQLAKAFRVVPSCLNHWENGERSIPGPVTILIELIETGLLTVSDDPMFLPLLEPDSISRRSTVLRWARQ